jgi:chemotaxis protein methyltransferase WspC
MSLARVRQLLKETIGLDADSIGGSAVERAVRERQAACGARDALAYGELLAASDVERQALTEAIVVPETWFFRDREAFAAFAAIAVDEWRSARPDRPRRVLSVPCSSGEEPYSIAMMVHEAGFPPGSFRIDAVDISRQLLAKARSGVYGQNSFRGGDLSFRAMHFDAVGDGYRIHDHLRSDVHWQQGNLVASGFLGDAEPYDAVFCRNLLIYFDRETQERAIATLSRLLSPRGVLFVGASESGALLHHELVSARIPMAFAHRRRGPSPRSRTERPGPTVEPSRTRTPTAAPAAPVRQTPPAGAGAGATSRTAGDAAREAEAAIALDEAYRLADQGHFSEAAERCEAYLRQRGPSERAFYLLGLVRDASGNQADAEAYYRKTLYLDPRHRPALAHLALLMDRLGKTADAQLLRERVRRLESTETTR